MFPLEFRGEVNREETRVMGLLVVKVAWTDGRTDGRWHIARYSMLSVNSGTIHPVCSADADATITKFVKKIQQIFNA